jgi:hypothetical protein
VPAAPLRCLGSEFAGGTGAERDWVATAEGRLDSGDFSVDAAFINLITLFFFDFLFMFDYLFY